MQIEKAIKSNWLRLILKKCVHLYNKFVGKLRAGLSTYLLTKATRSRFLCFFILAHEPLKNQLKGLYAKLVSFDMELKQDSQKTSFCYKRSGRGVLEQHPRKC